MAGFEHGGAYQATAEETQGAERRARWGLVLFALYFALYAGFMGLSAFAPQLMRSTPVGSVTLAVSYGFGLIVAALFLALVYGWVCRVTLQET